MPVNFTSIKAAAKAGMKTASENARSASSIDDALEIQAEGVAEAIKQALATFMAQAKVNGGTCSNGGPIADGIIS